MVYKHIDPAEQERRAAASKAFEKALHDGRDPAQLFAIAYDAGLKERDRVTPDRAHHVQLTAAERHRLRDWLAEPNGSVTLGEYRRATFDAVEGGGILVRTTPLTADLIRNGIRR